MSMRDPEPLKAIEQASLDRGVPIRASDGYAYYRPLQGAPGPANEPEGIEAASSFFLTPHTEWAPARDPMWLHTLVYRWPVERQAIIEQAGRPYQGSWGERGHNGGPPIETWEESEGSLPDDDAKRLDFPMFDGLLAYFPNALAEVSRVSKIGNDQHNPGQPMHWARGKSTDHGNKILRHLIDAGKADSRGVRHTARLAWRALAMLQEELEREEGYPASRAARLPEAA